MITRTVTVAAVLALLALPSGLLAATPGIGATAGKEVGTPEDIRPSHPNRSAQAVEPQKGGDAKKVIRPPKPTPPPPPPKKKKSSTAQ